jgi:hypothetical protein
MTALALEHTTATVVAPLRRLKDKAWWYVALAASVISVEAYAVYFRKGYSLAYYDTIPHLDIARRVIDSPTPGLGQLGGVWLPLPHLLSLPLIGIDRFYYNGFAAAIVSMIAYVVTSVLLYKIVYNLTGRKVAGFTGALVFMLNPGVLYMQSTPMTELLLFACMAGTVYGVQRWIQTDNYNYLIGGAFASLAGSLTRYEAWVIFGAMLVIVTLVPLVRHQGRERIEGAALTLAFMGGSLGIFLWVVWNGIIFGNPLNFQNGEFAKPSLWVKSYEKAIGHLWFSFKTYFYATTDNLGWAVFVLMVVGLLVIVVRERHRLEILPALSLFVLFPFFVLALYMGQRPLHVLNLGDGYYNVRFGLVMILPAAILVGYLAGLLLRRKASEVIVGLCLVVVLAVVTVVSFGSPARIPTLEEPLGALNEKPRVTALQASDYLRRNYDGGNILMEAFGNEFVLLESRIGPTHNINEGSYKLWEPALQDPKGNHIRWIIMRVIEPGTPPDKVFDALHGTAKLSANYDLVYKNEVVSVYKIKE